MENLAHCQNLLKMKIININCKEFKPHVKWILEELLNIPFYNITINICSHKKLNKIIPIDNDSLISGKLPSATYFPTLGFIWIDKEIVTMGDFVPVVAHELRHYYQFANGEFKFINQDEYNSNYENLPQELDAFEFQNKVEKHLSSLIKKKKTKLKFWYSKYTFI